MTRVIAEPKRIIIIIVERGNSLSEDWQIGFAVKGLIVPKEGIPIGDNVFIRGGPVDVAYVYFKSSIKYTEELDEFSKKMALILRDIVAAYGFVSNIHTEVTGGIVREKITSKTPFGTTRNPPYRFMMIFPKPTDEKRRDNVPILKKAIEIRKEVKERFLRNAIDYYSRSLGDLRLEEKLIDLMIAFESMFSGRGRAGGLFLGYALRATLFLSIGQKIKPSTIFDDIHHLYEKRNKVVHGSRGVKLDAAEISNFQKYIREAIKRFISIKRPKDEIFKLLDEAVYDEKEREKLNQIVLDAISK